MGKIAQWKKTRHAGRESHIKEQEEGRKKGRTKSKPKRLTDEKQMFWWVLCQNWWPLTQQDYNKSKTCSKLIQNQHLLPENSHLINPINLFSHCSFPMFVQHSLSWRTHSTDAVEHTDKGLIKDMKETERLSVVILCHTRMAGL